MPFLGKDFFVSIGIDVVMIETVTELATAHELKPPHPSGRFVTTLMDAHARVARIRSSALMCLTFD